MRRVVRLTTTGVVVAATLLGGAGCADSDVPTSVSTASIVVPNLVGESATEAHRQLDQLSLVTDFDAGDERVHDESQWIVATTSPAAGSHVFWGAAIVVHVARRP